MLSDLRYACRQLIRAPLFAIVVTGTLALCIGANSAIFSVIDAVLLRPYPWPGSERLVYVYNAYPLMGLANAGISIPDYLDRRTGVAAFADAALYTGQALTLGGAGRSEHLSGLRATPSLFSTLQTPPALGRVFTDAEARPGADKVVVISHALWQTHFAGDRSVLGRTIHLNGTPMTVIGVMPAGFDFPRPDTAIWMPFAFTDAQRSDAERGHEFSTMIARLKPGAGLAGVQRELDAIQVRNAGRLPQEREFWKTSGFGGRVAGFLETNVSRVRAMLWLVQGAVAAALLIGCANVASLLLARAAGRERELAIRAALGAGRGRLVGLLLTESVILFLAGGLLALLVAGWSITALQALGLSDLPRAGGVKIDPAVIAFTLACAIATGLCFGILPAWTAARDGASGALRAAGTRMTAGLRTQRLRAGLVTAEIAMGVMLVTAAGLLIRSLERLQGENPGFAPGGVLTAQIDLPARDYDGPAKLAAFHDALLARVRALPGVTAAGITTILPFNGDNNQQSYASPEINLPANAPLPHAQVRSVDSGYLGALGLHLLRGRWFADADRAGAPQVVVIDRLLADRYWPGQNPLGRHINSNGVFGGANLWEIVGVVAPVKVEGLDQTVAKETIYFPFDQSPDNGFMVVVRTHDDPAALTSAVRDAVRRIDPELPVFNIKTMTERMSEVVQPRRTSTILLSVFSAVALLLAVLGVYGVLGHFVTQRTPEFGIRMALGATGVDIAALVARQAAALASAGIVIGVAGYLALSHVVGRVLYGVPATDPAVLFLAPVALAVAALAACLPPLRRAIRADPASALRAE